MLRSYNLAEADKIVAFLTREHGLVRGVAKGARKLKSRFGASLEPFTVISLTFYEKEGRELVSVRQAEILRSHFHLSENADAHAALDYMCSLTMEFAPPHEPNERLFRMLKACVEAVAAVPERTREVLNYFELWMLKLAGFWPDFNACGRCGRRIAEGEQAALKADSTILCAGCSGRYPTRAIGAATRSYLRAIQRQAPADFAHASQQFDQPVAADVSKMLQHLIAQALERAPMRRELAAPHKSPPPPAAKMEPA